MTKESSVTETVPPNFSNSVFSAWSLFVSLIFKVARPSNEHLIPNPQHVTAMVCARSGVLFRFSVISSEGIVSDLDSVILFYEVSKCVSTPKFSNKVTKAASPCKLVSV